MKEKNKVEVAASDEMVKCFLIDDFCVEMDELVNSYEMVQIDFTGDEWYGEKDLNGVTEFGTDTFWRR